MNSNVFDDFDPEVQEYLAHHGIKGQRWGHRRFQNEDGSLTPAGRERYGVSEKKKGILGVFKEKGKLKNSSSKSSDQNGKKRKLSEVSDADLKRIIDRLKLEKEYKDLMKSKKGSSSRGAGKKFLANLLENSGKAIADGFIREYGAALGRALGKKEEEKAKVEIEEERKRRQKKEEKERQREERRRREEEERRRRQGQ